MAKIIYKSHLTGKVMQFNGKVAKLPKRKRTDLKNVTGPLFETPCGKLFNIAGDKVSLVGSTYGYDYGRRWVKEEEPIIFHHKVFVGLAVIA